MNKRAYGASSEKATLCRRQAPVHGPTAQPVLAGPLLTLLPSSTRLRSTHRLPDPQRRLLPSEVARKGSGEGAARAIPRWCRRELTAPGTERFSAHNGRDDGKGNQAIASLPPSAEPWRAGNRGCQGGKVEIFGRKAKNTTGP